MKYIIIYISLLFILSERHVNAQCLPNHEFGDNCGQVYYRDDAPTSPTFSDNCVPGWGASHGTPQSKWQNFGQNPSLYNPTNRPLWYTMYMWANGDAGRCRGEGIYAAYPFKKGNTYKISFRYMGYYQYPGQPTNATIQLKAMQDIKRPSKWKYGNLLPPTTRQDDIVTFSLGLSSTWLTSAVITYTPQNDDYNQIWIYPHSTTSNNQFNLYVDWVSVCRDDCASNTYYRQGVIPVGETKSANIYVGSSYGGTGTVTTSPTSHTTLIAANEIVFKPAFRATVTSGSFTAKLESCNTTPPTPNRPGESQDTSVLGLPVEVISFEEGGSYEDEYYESMARGAKPAAAKITEIVQSEIEKSLSVYPNPSRGVINITGGTRQFSNCTIYVTDLTGKQVYRKQHSLGSNNALDLSHLKNGVYNIQIRGDSKILSQKLVIIK